MSDQPIVRLKYIGPFFQNRFQQQHNPMQTFDDVIAYVSTHNKRQNTALFQRIFRNARWVEGNQNPARCIGDIARSRRPPHRYAIGRYNRFGWNSLVIYLRNNMMNNERFMQRTRQDRIPALIPTRTLIQAYPNYC
jgi:hypothetical protein